MSKFHIGDLVVLKSGSMKMLVEDVHEDDSVATVWCHEGVIGRDRFAYSLLNKWEHRGGDDRGGGYRGRDDRGHGGGGGYRGRDRDDRGGRDDRGHGGGGGWKGGRDDRDFDDRPRKQGWDGKPREKKYFRKDDD